MSVKLKLDKDAVIRIPMELVIPKVRKVEDATVRGARRTVRVKTGAVRNSIQVSRKVAAKKYVVTISATHRRALLEHDGAKRHRISQRPGGPMLRFFWEKVGRVVYFRSVRHPGTKGSQFLTKPLLKAGLRNGFTVTIRTAR